MRFRPFFGMIMLLSLGSFCLPMAPIAQHSIADSIEKILVNQPNDSARIALCIGKIRSATPDAGLVWLRKGKELAYAHHDLLSMAKLISEEAILANIDGQHVAGAKLFQQVDSIYRLVKDSMLIAGAQSNIGLSYYHAGQFDQALTHYFEAYKMYDHLPASTGFSRLLNNLAMCYKYTERPDEAKRYYMESIAIKKQLSDSVGYANTHHNLALLLSTQDDLNGAVASFDTAISIYHALGMKDDEASSNVALGKALMDHAAYERATDYLLSGYHYFRNTAPASMEFLLVAGDLAELYAHEQKWETANRYIDEALVLTTGADRISERVRLLVLKSQISDRLGNAQLAYTALEEAFALKDTLNSAQRMSLIEEMQTKFSVSEKEKDLEITQLALEGQQKLSRLYKAGLFATVLIALVIAALGMFLYRSRKLIQLKQKVIETTLREKELLLKEIHHRVKNNLQIISSLLSMQAYQSRDPHVSDAMREGQHRVRSMALIHQNLYQNASFVAVDASHYIHGLMDNLKQGYRLNAERIAVDTDIDDVRVDVDTMIPLGLIVNELVTNALKYAFPGDRKGRLLVALKAKQGTLALKVKDDGIGVDADKLKSAQSMGMTLVSDFCIKLKADLQISGDQGTEVNIRIPNASYAI